MAFVDDIAKIRAYRLLKSFSFKITVFLIATFVGILATIIKDSNSESKIKAERIEAQNQKSKSDSIQYVKQSEIYNLQLKVKDTIINKVDDAYQRSIYASNEALAKYNLQITDSLNSVISTLRFDAVKTNLVMVVSDKGIPPAYFVKEGNKDILNLRFTAQGGTCYNIDIEYYIIGEDSMSILQEGKIMQGSYILYENISTTYSLKINPVIFNDSNMILLLRGSFSLDPMDESQVRFDRILKIDLKERKFISFGDIDYENLIIIKGDSILKYRQ